MLKAKHNKLRNTGLLFEFLLRQITSDVLNKVDDSKAVFIVKKKFNENTELGKELALYNIIINKKFDSDRKADYFINEVINERQKLVNSTLRREKYNLIKIINEYYDLRKFISSKVDNYKIHASIYKLFEYSNILSPEDKTESHFNIVEHITSKDRSVNFIFTTLSVRFFLLFFNSLLILGISFSIYSFNEFVLETLLMYAFNKSFCGLFNL